MSYQKSSTRRSSRSQLLGGLTCRYHPSNLLHTFCLHNQCMLPMCSLCISLHGNQHREANSHGIYKSIDELSQEAYTELSHNLRKLEELNSEYSEDYQKKNKYIESCRDMISQLRRKVHEKIQLVFDQMELSLENVLQAHDEHLQRLYNDLEQRVHSKYNQLVIDQQIFSFLYNQDQISFNKGFSLSTNANSIKNSSEMKEYKFIKKIIEYYGEDEMEKNQTEIDSFRKQVEDIKKISKIGVIVDKEKVKQILGKVKQFFKIEGTGNNQERKSLYNINRESNDSQENNNNKNFYSFRKGGLPRISESSGNAIKKIATDNDSNHHSDNKIPQDWSSFQSVKYIKEPQTAPIVQRHSNPMSFSQHKQKKSFLKMNEGSSSSIIGKLHKENPGSMKYLSPQHDNKPVQYAKSPQNQNALNSPHNRWPTFTNPITFN